MLHNPNYNFCLNAYCGPGEALPPLILSLQEKSVTRNRRILMFVCPMFAPPASILFRACAVYEMVFYLLRGVAS